jgi:LacI family transcriptional regulator
MAHPIAMKEIALQAGVSLATVDRVLHQREGVRTTTRRRVEQACAELARQQQQIGLTGRRVMIDLVMEAPDRFSRIVRETLGSAMRQARPAVFRAREHLAETLSVADLVAVLDGIARSGSHGVLLKAPDVPGVNEAVLRLMKRGIPVVTLVTDLKGVPAHAYVGLDNERAGETAAYLMAQWMPSAKAKAEVLVSSSGQRFQGEDERIQAFTRTLNTMRPACKVHVLDKGRGLPGPTAASVRHLLATRPGVSAVYSVGGANQAILAAFDKAGRTCRPFIGHDLDADNLALLRAGRLSAVLHHDLHHDLHMACLHFMQAQGLSAVGSQLMRSDIEVITPFNLPQFASQAFR